MDIPVDPALQPNTKSLRRREVDPTESVRYQLFSHAQAHPKATQQELAQWFNITFKNQINQSTVSRMLYPFRLLVEIPIEYFGHYPCACDTKQYPYICISALISRSRAYAIIEVRLYRLLDLVGPSLR